MSQIEHVEATAWRRVIEGALEGGELFGGAWASAAEGRLRWNVLLNSTHAPRVISCEPPAGAVETIVDLVEAAAWDEREAHDLYGLEFRGHSPLRTLVTHSEDPATWMTAVTGEGVHQVAVGPVHAGVIESGHFRFHVVGERILALDLKLFYKHRGLERASEGLAPEHALAHAGRACAACFVTNSVAFAQAVEDAGGLQPNRELRVLRTVALELERLYNHLHDIGAICSGVGFAPGSMAFAALKDRAQQLNLRAFGHRFLFGAVRLGAGGPVPDAASTDALRCALRELHTDSAAAWRELEFTSSLQARLDGIGVLSGEDALRLGAVGPAARAAGIREDARSASPRLAYDSFTAAGLADASGDVGARLRLRALELESTYELLDELLAKPLRAGAVSGAGPATALGLARVESPRGATTCAVELEEGRVARMHLRTGSYANWPALAHATAGNLLGDFPLINKSFELCYACVDR